MSIPFAPGVQPKSKAENSTVQTGDVHCAFVMSRSLYVTRTDLNFEHKETRFNEVPLGLPHIAIKLLTSTASDRRDETPGSAPPAYLKTPESQDGFWRRKQEDRRPKPRLSRGDLETRDFA